jgi:hypothetical protein
MYAIAAGLVSSISVPELTWLQTDSLPPPVRRVRGCPVGRGVRRARPRAEMHPVSLSVNGWNFQLRDYCGQVSDSRPDHLPGDQCWTSVLTADREVLSIVSILRCAMAH